MQRDVELLSRLRCYSFLFMSDKLVKLTVNGIPVAVPETATVIQACGEANVSVPRYCYHEKLSLSGNCRQCLVELEGSPKLIASCAYPVGNGMKIHTNTERVRKAREAINEFLLINHPLDCPVCVQGGNCDLQDQALTYGGDKGRFTEAKRSAPDKNIGPFISLIQTRSVMGPRFA